MAVQSSRIRRDVALNPESTGGFKYVPGGRECFVFIFLTIAVEEQFLRAARVLLAIW